MNPIRIFFVPFELLVVTFFVQPITSFFASLQSSRWSTCPSAPSEFSTSFHEFSFLLPRFIGLWGLDNAGCSRICPTWFCEYVSLPSWVYYGLWNKFVASQLVRVELHETFPFNYIIRDWQGIKSMFLKLAILLWRSQSCTACTITQCLVPNIASNLGIVLWKWSRTFRSTPCFPCCGLIPSTSRWAGWIWGSCLSLPSATRDLGVFQIGGSGS